MNTENIYIHNDVTFTKNGAEKIFTHHKNKFPAFTQSAEEEITQFHELYVTPAHGIRVMLHLHYLAYVIVNPKGVVIGKEIQSYDEAIKKAEEVDQEYAHWFKEQICKGISKSKFISDVKAGNLQAKLVSTRMKGRNLDTDFHPLVKHKGYGSIDIHRNEDGYRALFYINDMASARMVYTGTELLIYNSGFRLYNDHEKSVLTQWETMRDKKEEMLDALTDGSTQFWRKHRFFEEQGVAHLFTNDYRGLVLDDKLRGECCLKYEIRHS